MGNYYDEQPRRSPPSAAREAARARGSAAELAAEQWLQKQGLVPLVRNYLCRCGEIDLIMRHGEHLVFVEVRLRSQDRFGGAGASVTRQKRQRLERAARQFLVSHAALAHLPCRFDVLTTAAADDQWQWLQNAFDAGS